MFYFDWYVLLFAVSAPLGFLIFAAVAGQRAPERNRTFTTILLCCMSVMALGAVLVVSSANSGFLIETKIADQAASQLAVDRADLRHSEDHWLIDDVQVECDGLASFTDLFNHVKDNLGVTATADQIDTAVDAAFADLVTDDFTCTAVEKPTTYGPGAEENS